MAVTTFEDFYNLTKNNVVYFRYRKGDAELGIKGTLKRELIPENDNNLQKYDSSIFYSDFYLGLWEGSDSDKAELTEEVNNNKPRFGIPEWLKIYSTNYDTWINIEISKILSLEVVAN